MDEIKSRLRLDELSQQYDSTPKQHMKTHVREENIKGVRLFSRVEE